MRSLNRPVVALPVDGGLEALGDVPSETHKEPLDVVVNAHAACISAASGCLDEVSTGGQAKFRHQGIACSKRGTLNVGGVHPVAYSTPVAWRVEQRVDVAITRIQRKAA